MRVKKSVGIYTYINICMYMCVYIHVRVYIHIYNIHTYYTYTYQGIPPLGPCPVYACERERVVRDDDTLVNTVSRKHTHSESLPRTHTVSFSH